MIGIERLRARARTAASRFGRNVYGSTGIEYAAVAALSAIVIAGGLKMLGPQLAQLVHRASAGLLKDGGLLMSEVRRTSARGLPSGAVDERARTPRLGPNALRSILVTDGRRAVNGHAVEVAASPLSPSR